MKKRYPTARCKVCITKATGDYAAKRRQINPAKENLYFRERYAKIKEEVFQHYGGYLCACCGETEKIFLSLDHINNDGGEFRIKTFGTRIAAGYRTYEWLWRNEYPEECQLQVLCANCQYGKRMNKGVCPHQVRCNDHSVTEVESSDSKRTATQRVEDMVLPNAKVLAAKM